MKKEFALLKTMLRLISVALLLAHGVVQANPEFPFDRRPTAQVSHALHNKDCPGAVKELNKALKSKAPEVLLLAGGMYEEGICLKPNLDQAAKYFMLASDAGHPRAMPRLIAMYARTDAGSALWWANRTGQGMPEACSSAHPAADRLEAFVSELNSWPKERLAACVYTLGVFNRILGLAEFPEEAAAQGIFGKVSMEFLPAEGIVRWKKMESETIGASGVVAAEDSERWVFKNTIMKYVESIGKRALKEYPKPNGIDPNWKLETQVVFSLSYI